MPSSAHFLADFSHELAALAARTAKSTVAVHGGNRVPSSGFIWRPGLVVTAEETLETDEDLSILAPDGREIAATLVGRDPSTAVAVLKVDETELAPLAAAATVPGLGEIVLVVGRSGGGATAHFGTVALSGAAWRSLRGGDIDALIRLDVVAGRSSEGGPVVDAEGKLTGMLVFGPRRGMLVIPFATLERVAAHLLAKGRVARSYLGLGLRPIRIEAAGGRGLIVVSVDPDGPAHKAGMFIGDVITTWDGEPIGGMRGLMRRLGSDSVGTHVKLGVLRAGADVDVALAVAERPA
jgi:S1-C subfamily serine protease